MTMSVDPNTNKTVANRMALYGTFGGGFSNCNNNNNTIINVNTMSVLHRNTMTELPRQSPKLLDTTGNPITCA